MNTHRESILSSPARSPSLPIALLQRKCSCGTHTTGGATCEECKDEAKVQRKGGHDSRQDEAPASVYDVLRSRGDALDSGDRSFFESRYGQDFGRVRVHSDSAAANSANAVSASAYTVGHHVVFGQGHYRPNTPAGRELLAHELAHVVQQRHASIPSSGLKIGSSSSSLESSADHAASRAMSGKAGHLASAGGPTLSRKPEEKKCPTTHKIPDDVHKAMDTAWKASGHGGDTVSEQGGSIVTDSASKRQIRPTTGGSGSISYPTQTGDVVQGTYHSHPYSKSEGPKMGVSFSGGDITNFVSGVQGTYKYIAAGTCNFVLDTLDMTARDACKTVDINKRWNDTFAAGKSSFANNVEAGVKAAIAGCGLCYYKACRPDNKSPIPKVAQLVS